ncbi:GPR1/FUN34/yaaH family-domain-containing protein [Aspergillus welwitschiae]|uniref:GPR1/FUN34/yaaH family-domain-containing protein n=1 Tax=Aspergillus welwitschiae TaxID=1341132 RepID=A0A3F3PP17_9EURO|nr:GPR1/FUN34/yaaH family-domain-containing protein [Aspergillus welwitschiae]RDH28677.1 GPR1/FUN34/yaaH family-domain-containing protein [Aspergillus welwitschiae]
MPSDNLSLFPATSMSSTPSSQEKPPTAEPTLVRTNTSTATPNDSYHFDFGPLAHVNTAGTIYPAFAGELQPGLWKPQKRRKIANPAPLGLCGFALTTFLLGCINMQTLGIATPNMIVGPALAYGGLVQLLAGMWEMAAGNTFGATALSSYGGFWISLSIVFTPGGFDIQGAYKAADNGSMGMFYDAFGLYLMGWFIFTFLLWLCTLKSTYVFCALFAAVDIALLLLAVGYIHRTAPEVPNAKIIKAGGLFALLGAFMAWYVALAGIADDSNSFFLVPVFHFPWSEKGRESRRKEAESAESV